MELAVGQTFREVRNDHLFAPGAFLFVEVLALDLLFNSLLQILLLLGDGLDR